MIHQDAALETTISSTKGNVGVKPNMEMTTRKSKKTATLLIAVGLAMLAAVATAGTYLFIQREATFKPPSPTASEYTVDSDGYPGVDWEYWQSVNPHTIGWITVPGTRIDQPLVQEQPDNRSYYLDHDIYGNTSIWGSAYISADCFEEGLESTNVVVYAHNNGDGAMFGDFSDYTRSEYAADHDIILIQTPNWKKTLTVDFAEVTGGWETVKRTDFATVADYRSWYIERRSNAVTILSDPSSGNAGNYSFVTCSYNRWDNERTIVYASYLLKPHQKRMRIKITKRG